MFTIASAVHTHTNTYTDLNVSRANVKREVSNCHTKYFRYD